MTKSKNEPSFAFYKPPLFPCSDHDHYPFKTCNKVFQLLLEINGEEKLTDCLLGTVRTESHAIDGCGGRTDLHDIFSLCWAAHLRAFGVASPFLVAEGGFAGIPSEIYERIIYCPISGASRDIERSIHSFKAWAAFAYHELDYIFDWRSVFSGEAKWYDDSIEDLAPWLLPLIKHIGLGDNHNFVVRRKPNWAYYSDFDKGVTVLRLAKYRMNVLRILFAGFNPKAVRGQKSLCISASGLQNAIPLKVLNKGRKYLKLCEGIEDPTQIIPMENVCIFLGNRTFIAIYGDCGQQRFEEERNYLLSKRSEEDAVFFSNAQVSWKDTANYKAFENLAADLLELEPGVASVKQVGKSNDRDGGKDLIVSWRQPSQAGNNEKIMIRKILVQVKTRKKSVGKGDVTDIRDTIEFHKADGFVLLAYPNVTSQLTEHLASLQDRYFVEWWNQRDWEERLRRQPQIALRYPELVTLVP